MRLHWLLESGYEFEAWLFAMSASTCDLLNNCLVMPKRSDKDNEITVNSGRKRGPKARIASNGHKLPEKLPLGEILTDLYKQQWILGPSIGLGGFGEIYLVSNDIGKPVGPDSRYVIKVEHHHNGPLFSEMHFYHRVGKEDSINAWVKKKGLDYLGMPRFISSGSHEYKGIKYRFMVMDRFGEDLQKILVRSNNVFSLKTVFTLGLRIVDVLEYIHSFGYIHADVKASNLLLGYGKDNQNKVFLIDFGLACRFMSGNKHKEYKEDLRKAHDGTIEFTSRDAHIGAHSRRGDLEILGYNMVQWLCGQLPWEDNLKDPEYVSHQKSGYMMNVPLLMEKCFPNENYPEGILTFLEYIGTIKFEEEPNYDHCRSIFRSALKKAHVKDDMKLSFTSPQVVKASKRATTHMSKSPAKKPVNGCGNNRIKNSSRTKAIAISSSSEDETEITTVKECLPSRSKGTRRDRIQSQEPQSEKSKPTRSGSTKYRSQKKSSTSTDDAFVDGDSTATKHDSSLENPTPAMLQVMQRKLELQKEGARPKKKTFATFSASGNTMSDTYKEQVVRKYKEKSPELFGIVESAVVNPDKLTGDKHIKKPKRLPRSQLAKESNDRRPLATRPSQDPPPRHYRENSYSPEV